ncbi:MAG TPA: hydrogen gas-evolving membrane-bound hydrogenase subunit E [Opitutaceae bacterium]
MAPLLLIAIFFPVALMPVVAAIGARLGRFTGWFALLAPLASTAALTVLAIGSGPGERVVVELAWIPTLALNLTFLVDGLSLFFGLVVSGMGVFVVFYATQYLDEHYSDHGRFYAYLLLFMSAMLGTVLAGNLLLLLVFWELTGVASFLLIGFLHGRHDSRAGARMALLVTAATGLVMLAGIVLVGVETGTYDLARLLSGEIGETSRATMSAAFVLVAIGAFGKSAQFPFHFWLPNAMAAPTPVSAYLHSATMVKLGVFLVARVFPLFREVELWTPLLAGACFGTAVLAAVLALLSHDLKAILAYSTVSQLGLLIGSYGLAAPLGTGSDLLHITNHVLYKGSLFMAVGAIDHATGVRDARHLGGLRRRLPWLCLGVFVAAASMAGLPGTLGFLSKEAMLKETLDHWRGEGALGLYPAAMLVATSVLKVAFSARLAHGLFFGRESEKAVAHFHAPGAGLQAAPLLLALACAGFGLAPAVLGNALHQLTTPRLHVTPASDLALWHGVTPELLLSGGIVAAGAGLYVLLHRAQWRGLAVPSWLRFDVGFESGVQALPVLAKRVTTMLRSDRPLDYLPLAFGFLLLLVGGYVAANATVLLPGWPGPGDFDLLRSFVVLLIAMATGLVITLRRWAGQLISLSIVGFLITFYFVLFQAPDLAMTQILVESATLLLVLLLLARFPRSTELARRARSHGRRGLALVLAVGVGALTTIFTLMAVNPKHPQAAGDYYLQATVPLAHGTNAVNTILVDFRGFDTLLEITVLTIACLGAVGLLMRYRRTPDEYAAGEKGPAGYGVIRRPRTASEERRSS